MAALLAAGCTKPNPRACADGTCTDPEFPFCDVDGAFEDIPNQCIAVDCTPMEIAGCRGDFAITCNAVGTDFDLVQCERGCEDGVGCRLCSPNETACTNGTVATCDSAGTVIESQTCPLGCFEDEPRCREIDPSNNLAQFLDMSDSAEDLVLENASIDTSNGDLKDMTGQLLPARLSALIPSPVGGAQIRVFVGNRVRLANVKVVGGPALAVVAREDITINGTLSLSTNEFTEETVPAPGSVDLSACRGAVGAARFEGGSPGQFLRGGSGGGGHATAGGRGGNVGTPELQTRYAPGGAGGSSSGSPELIPLRGGCSGGNGGGGGAVQLVSRTAIVVEDGAVIDANGQIGTAYAQGPGLSLGGGGAGGGILLEAPIVDLRASSRLLVNGGPSATETELTPSVSQTQSVSRGGTCQSAGTYRCSNGGNGAAADGPASNGGDVDYQSSTITDFAAGGGGGGLGYIRINTAEGSFTAASTAIVSGSVSEGLVRTR